jgi:hypothetical protein
MALVSLDIEPSRRQLRHFSGIWFPALVGVIGYLGLRWGWWDLASLAPIWLFAGTIALVGVCNPRFIRPVFFGLIYAVYPIGLVLSQVILAVVYFAVITPVGLALRKLAEDPMKRSLDRSAESYWVRRAPGEDMESYLRQY